MCVCECTGTKASMRVTFDDPLSASWDLFLVVCIFMHIYGHVVDFVIGFLFLGVKFMFLVPFLRQAFVDAFLQTWHLQRPQPLVVSGVCG